MNRDPPTNLSPSGEDAVDLNTSPLLDRGVDEGEDNPDKFVWCWCCPLYRCLFGGCIGKHPQPISTRSLDCAAHFLFWCSGMYAPGGEFSRQRWNLLNDVNKSAAGISKSFKVRSYDTSVQSSNVSSLRIPVRVYEPLDLAEDEKVIPLVYYHGGGFCIGEVAQTNFHVLCLKFASRCRVVVVSVGYRLAPEHPFPAGVQDCYDAIKHLFVEPESLSKHIDLGQGGAIVAGDSAGGNLACVVASLARDGIDANLKMCTVPIKIRHQVLIYPALFMLRPDADEFKDGSAFLPPQVTSWFRRSYLPMASTQKELEELALTDRRLGPFVAGFERMPQVTLVSAGLDHLRYENKMAQQQFELAGIDCVHHHVEGVPHGFMTFHFLNEAKDTFDKVARDMMRPIPKKQNQSTRRSAIVKGHIVELISCKGAWGMVTSVREEDGICEVDLNWGKAYAPVTNVFVLK